MDSTLINITKTRWVYVFLSILLMMIYGTVYSWSIFRVAVEDYFNIGTALSGLPYMMFLLFYAISMLIGGKFIEKYPPNRILIFGGLFICLGWIFSSISIGIVSLTISYGVVIGFGVGISYGVPIYVMAKWFPNKKGMIVGLVLAGFGLSPLLTAPLGRWLIYNSGLKATFLYYGIIFGVLIPLISILIRIPVLDKLEQKEDKKVLVNKTAMTKTKSFKYAYICFFIGTLIGLTIIGLTNNVGTNVIGIGANDVAIMMVVFAIFNGIGRPLFGWMTEKYGTIKSMGFSYVLIIIASICMLFANEGSTIVYIIAFSILWLNLGAWLAIAPIMTMKLYGMESYSENYGIMFTAYGVGAVVGVLSTGILIDLFNNYKLIFLLFIAFSVLGLIMSKKVK
jgi:MFS family permease